MSAQSSTQDLSIANCYAEVDPPEPTSQRVRFFLRDQAAQLITSPRLVHLYATDNANGTPLTDIDPSVIPILSLNPEFFLQTTIVGVIPLALICSNGMIELSLQPLVSFNKRLAILIDGEGIVVSEPLSIVI